MESDTGDNRGRQTRGGPRGDRKYLIHGTRAGDSASRRASPCAAERLSGYTSPDAQHWSPSLGSGGSGEEHIAYLLPTEAAPETEVSQPAGLLTPPPGTDIRKEMTTTLPGHLPYSFTKADPAVVRHISRQTLPAPPHGASAAVGFCCGVPSCGVVHLTTPGRVASPHP